MADWTISNLTTAQDVSLDDITFGTDIVIAADSITTTYGTKNIGNLSLSKLTSYHTSAANYSFNPMRPVHGQLYPRFNK